MRYLLTLLLLAIALHAAPWSPATVDGFTPSLMRGLVEAWEFNETSAGTAATGRVAGIVLTDFNSVARTTNGKLDGGLTNNSAAKWLESSNTNLNYTNFTVRAWYAPNNTAVSQTLVNRDGASDGTRNWSLVYSSTGPSWSFVVATNNGAADIQVVRWTNSTINVFRHVVGVKSNLMAYLYVDGELRASLDMATAATNSSTKFTVGALQNNISTVELNGIIDEVAFWNRPLTAAEILQDYNIGKARRFPFNSGP